MMKSGDMYRLACGTRFARLREQIEWNGWHAWMVEQVSTSTHSTPFQLETQTDGQIEYWLKNATAIDREEWIAAVAKATKIRGDIDRKQREREDAERFGVHVKRKRSASYYGSRREPGPDRIVRATKTRWPPVASASTYADVSKLQPANIRAIAGNRRRGGTTGAPRSWPTTSSAWKYKPRSGSYGVVGDGQPSPTIRGHHSITQAPASIADPRVGWDYEAHGGRPHSYGVQDWREPSPTVRGSQRIQNTRGSVADPRLPVPTHEIVEVSGRPVLVGGPIDIDDAKSSGYRVIRAIDGSWHRPMTDLELAVIQGFPSEVDGKLLQLTGSSAQRRKHIGNAVPPPTAEAIARECMATLEAASDGWSLVPGGDIWVEERREW